MLARLAFVPLLGAAQVPAPPDVAVEWVAPPECPDRAAVVAAIARRLGRPPATDEAVVTAHVTRVEPRAFTLRLRLSAGTRSETREVTDPSCAALADVVALLVAAAIDPATAGPQPQTQPQQESETSPVAPEPAEAPAPPPERPDPIAEPPADAPGPALSNVPYNRSPRPGGFVRLHGGGELGAVPGVTGAVGLAGGLLGRRWRLEVQGLVVVPRAFTHPIAREVRVGLYAGAVHGCRRLGRGAIEVPLCLGLEAGAMRGEARGLSSSRPAFQAWLAGVLGAGLAWHASPRWSLWGAVQLVLAPVYPRFVLGDSAQVAELWKPSPASGRLLLGVEFRAGDRW